MSAVAMRSETERKMRALKKLQACGEFTQVYEAVRKDASRR